MLVEEGVLVSIWLKSNTHTSPCHTHPRTYKTKWVRDQEPSPPKEKGLLFTPGSPCYCPIWRSGSKTKWAFELQDVPMCRVLRASGHKSQVKRPGLKWGKLLKLMPHYSTVFKACRGWYEVKYNRVLYQFTEANPTSLGATGTKNEDRLPLIAQRRAEGKVWVFLLPTGD